MNKLEIHLEIFSGSRKDISGVVRIQKEAEWAYEPGEGASSHKPVSQWDCQEDTGESWKGASSDQVLSRKSWWKGTLSHKKKTLCWLGWEFFGYFRGKHHTNLHVLE